MLKWLKITINKLINKLIICRTYGKRMHTFVSSTSPMTVTWSEWATTSSSALCRAMKMTSALVTLNRGFEKTRPLPSSLWILPLNSKITCNSFQTGKEVPCVTLSLIHHSMIKASDFVWFISFTTCFGNLQMYDIVHRIVYISKFC